LRGTTIKNADDFSMYLLSEANVATVTGDAFGDPKCIRFSYATSEEQLIEAMRRIKEVLA
jgi:aspartate aminotransferase